MFAAVLLSQPAFFKIIFQITFFTLVYNIVPCYEIVKFFLIKITKIFGLFSLVGFAS